MKMQGQLSVAAPVPGRRSLKHLRKTVLQFVIISVRLVTSARKHLDYNSSWQESRGRQEQPFI